MGAADSRTGILTLLLNTCQVRGALLVDGALRLAFNVRVPLETRQALTGGCPVSFIANCVSPTRSGVARVNDFWPPSGGCDSVASVKGISLVSLVADTNRHMIPDPTVGIDATETGTRVLTLSGDAGQLLGAVRVDHTLRATVRGRANHLGHTGAPTLTTNIPWRECVWSTWVGVARVLLNNRLNWYWTQSAGRKGISFITLDASAGGDVVDHPAPSIGATQARARVHTV